MPTATLAYNPTAGDRRHSRVHLVALLGRAGFSVRSLSTKQPGLDATLRRPADMVVAAGGDGTVAKVARIVEGAGIPLAIAPIGTANNIARSLGLLHSVPRNVAGWRSAGIRPVDLVRVIRGARPGTAVEGVGIGAFAAAALRLHLSNRAAENPKRAILEARRAMGRALAEAKPIPHLKVDGEDLSGEALFVEVLNIPRIGPALRLCREASAEDGLLDIVYGAAAHRKPLVEWLKDGAPPHEAPGLASLGRVTNVKLKWAGAVSRVDDEFVGASDDRTKLRLEVVSGRLEVVAPQWRP